MWDKVSIAFKFVGSIAAYYVSPTPQEFRLVEVVELPSKTPVTAQFIPWLAVSPDHARRWGVDVLMRYVYKGTNEHLMYFSKDEQIVFPPRGLVLPMDVGLCVLEGMSNSGTDVTKVVNAFAGPDGRWHGRLTTTEETQTLSGIPPSAILEGSESIDVTLVEGGFTISNEQKQEQEVVID